MDNRFVKPFYENNRVNFALAVLLSTVMAAMNIFISWTLGEVVDAVSQMDGRALGKVAFAMGAGTPCFLLIDLLAQWTKQGEYRHLPFGLYKRRRLD